MERKQRYRYPERLVVGRGAVSRPSELRKRETAAIWYLRSDGNTKNIRKKGDKE